MVYIPIYQEFTSPPASLTLIDSFRIQIHTVSVPKFRQFSLPLSLSKDTVSVDPDNMWPV
jgi:hypothetical protein